MGQIIPTFEAIFSGSGSVGTETWIDLGVIPLNRAFWFGFATFISIDKTVSFELRTNNTGQFSGTTANTFLWDYSQVTGGQGVDRDFYRGGTTITMSAMSTGVEHAWLRITSGSSNVGAYNYIIYYTIY